jgi:hypothetical protein
MGSVAKSYIRKGFLKYKEKRKYFTIYTMRRTLVKYDFAQPLYEENLVLFFISVWMLGHIDDCSLTDGSRPRVSEAKNAMKYYHWSNLLNSQT